MRRAPEDGGFGKESIVIFTGMETLEKEIVS